MATQVISEESDLGSEEVPEKSKEEGYQSSEEEEEEEEEESEEEEEKDKEEEEEEEEEEKLLSRLKLREAGEEVLAEARAKGKAKVQKQAEAEAEEGADRWEAQTRGVDLKQQKNNILKFK
jgi:hypothetical protein